MFTSSACCGVVCEGLVEMEMSVSAGRWQVGWYDLGQISLTKRYAWYKLYISQDRYKLSH